MVIWGVGGECIRFTFSYIFKISIQNIIELVQLAEVTMKYISSRVTIRKNIFQIKAHQQWAIMKEVSTIPLFLAMALHKKFHGKFV